MHARTRHAQGNLALALAAALQVGVCVAWYRYAGALSATGIVVANMASMGARVAYAVCAIASHLRGTRALARALPSPLVWAILALAVAATGASKSALVDAHAADEGGAGLRAHATHVGVGVGALACVGAAVVRSHYRELRDELRAMDSGGPVRPKTE